MTKGFIGKKWTVNSEVIIHIDEIDIKLKMLKEWKISEDPPRNAFLMASYRTLIKAMEALNTSKNATRMLNLSADQS